MGEGVRPAGPQPPPPLPSSSKNRLLALAILRWSLARVIWASAVRRLPLPALSTPRTEDGFIGLQGMMETHLHADRHARPGKAPHRVGHHFIEQCGEDAPVDDVSPPLVLPGQSQLGLGRLLLRKIGHLNLQPPGVVPAADKAIIVGDGGDVRRRGRRPFLFAKS